MCPQALKKGASLHPCRVPKQFLGLRSLCGTGNFRTIGAVSALLGTGVCCQFVEICDVF